ncbi:MULTISPECIES: alpha/beta hydrolase [Paenibacillus]|uniref:Alpha/beta fold hydrolase n=1 Tax=Paenibacillus validus TaxID=44253 RepID=A0A7X2Z976_9BACL|nr:alpha/beta hydrolase [Paenibacillus validus]MUG70025.1 alpha/beta fold hydrolase [Paenibacillus validus]
MTQRDESIVHERFTLPAGQLDTGEPLYIRGDVRLAAGGQTAPKPVLLICHGFKGFKDWGFFPYAASRFAERNYYVVTFNFSCNGVNETDFDELNKFAVNTYSREQADLETLLQALRERKLPLADHADLQRLILLGHSKGGGTSIIFAAEHPEVQAVVTWNGIGKTDLFDDAFKAQIAEQGVAYVANVRTKQEMPIRASFYEDLRANGDRFDIAQRLAGLHIPVLQVQGDQDSPRLKAGFELLRSAAPQHRDRIVTIEGGTHTFGAVHPFRTTTPELEGAIHATIQFMDDATNLNRP